jgi:heparosan-N-sulfate-glucuronate 5-epimerase
MKLMRFQLTLCLLAAGSGCFISNYTAAVLDSPAQKLMAFSTGRTAMSPILDEHDIPKVYYSKLRDSFYNPVHIASRAAALYKHKSDPEKGAENVKTFLKYADWLKNNLEINTYDGLVYGIWEYNFPWATYKLTPPWRSGMAQGAGLDILSKAHQIKKDPAYLISAKYALNAFLVDVKNGGVTYQDSDEEWWIEEYIGTGGLESRVLNGAIYALLDIYEFWKITGDAKAWEVYHKGLNSIIKRLPKYDTGWWSYYDAIGTIATQKYHKVHIELLRDLYNISGEEIFLQYSNRWANYKDSYFIREFIKQRPDYHDMVILGLNMLAIWLIGNFAAALRLICRIPFRSHA